MRGAPKITEKCIWISMCYRPSSVQRKNLFGTIFGCIWAEKPGRDICVELNFGFIVFLWEFEEGLQM